MESPGSPQGAIMDLFEAIKRGHEDDVSRLLDADPNSLEEQHHPYPSHWYKPLHCAAVYRRLGMVRLLVGRGANIHSTDGERRTALYYAAERGHEEIVAFLLNQGANADIKDRNGWTPFMAVAWEGHLSVIKMLVAHTKGKGLNEQNDLGRTALYYAAGWGYEGIVRAFLLAGADCNMTDGSGRTSLAIAREDGHQGCIEVFEWWEGELERRYFLQRARCLYDAFMEQQATPTAPVPAFLQERKATSQALPQVEVVARQQEEQQAGSSGQEGASTEAGSTEEEEEVHAVLAHVVGQLNEQLFTELVQCFHA